MAAFAVFALGLVILAVMSLRANRRFAAHARLPMQWGFDGTVTWQAPRRVALAFTPLLALAIMLVIGTLVVNTVPAGDKAAMAGVAVLMVSGFVAVHAFHLRLIARSLGAA